MLLPLLEQDESAILKREAGTLFVQVDIMTAKQHVDEMKVSGATPPKPSK
jgi:hypothetical protein